MRLKFYENLLLDLMRDALNFGIMEKYINKGQT